MKKWFQGLRGRLLTLVGVSVFIMGITGGVGIYGLKSVSADLMMVMTNRIPITNEVGTLRMAINAIMRFSWKALGQTNPEIRQKAIADAKERIKLFEETREALMKRAINEESKRVVADMGDDLDKLKSSLGKSFELLASGEEKSRVEAQALLAGTVNDAAGELTSLAKKLDEMSDKRNEAIIEEVSAANKVIVNAVVGAIFVGTIVLFMLGIWIANTLAQLLSGIASNLNSSADNVASAATQVSAASEQLSASAVEQASSIQETASASEELSAMVSRNSESANKGKDASSGSLDLANRGMTVVQNMIDAIHEIDSANSNITAQVEKSNQEISEIVKVIQEIGTKTKVINDIVFQTKLLSFNASVEAARAGENGKGFAVVAEEVGNLAQMSGNAAKEISNLLEGSIQKVEQIVRETKGSVENLVAIGKQKVESGNQISQECGKVLQEIVQGSNTVSSIVTEISKASDEQSRGISQINEAMAQFNEVTQQNSAASNQAASSAAELSSQAESMRSMVLELKRTIDGPSSVESNRAPLDFKRNSKARPSAGGKIPKAGDKGFSEAA